jgi:hypothetical protein
MQMLLQSSRLFEPGSYELTLAAFKGISMHYTRAN